RRSFAAMARVGIAMLLHDRLKLVGTLVGVIFAVLLSNQQAATFFGLLDKNTMLARRSGADIWVTPPATESLQPGALMSDSTLVPARGRSGVAWAAPLLLAGGTVKLPSGGTEAIQIIGVDLPALHGGPWNVVSGDPRDLARPDAMFFEDSDREKLGGLNLRSVREVSGHRAQAGRLTVRGFTVGLIPFGPSYAFTRFETAREITHTDNHLTNFALVGVAPGASPAQVARLLQERLPEQRVMLRSELERRTVRYVLANTSIGV